MNTYATLTYVYAVTRPTPRLAEALASLEGIGRAPVRLLLPGPPVDVAAHPDACGADHAFSGAGPAPLAFAASEVPESDFNEQALKNHFEDLEWLEYVARTHHDVVQAIAAHATVLPLRMATVYQDEGRARQALTAQRRTFTRRLDELGAHTEYGVKIYLTSPSTTEGTRADDGAAATHAAPASPGKAYLHARRAQHHAREAVYQQARQAAAAIEAIADRHATRRVRHAPQSGALTGPQENVLNDAYLVPDDQAEPFRSAIAGAAGDFPDLRIEVTGPWAPYSFAMPAPDGPPDPQEPPS
ncbi:MULTISPECIES: GvpL/GvpF family gas vesicle protein [unclassified Streptomyces]|uniref:GvpL/GvpF family gas vesicle protein n=1 Tax=unclassified Streptomyces TaxID=2593676 RepID=UPI002E36270B|nr:MULTISPECIES: GvpL/GvpF family gas vesicle protein [unclassified Streptomyces]WUC68129.1 GvpL/GvpF family gas vesicle protein [Streptomyces sp. NBC_00539]